MILRRFKKIYFVGIGGIGMSGIAEIMFNMNFKIEGSDVNENSNTLRLQEMGIKINVGHDSKNIKTFDLAVISSAIRNKNKEILLAKNYKIPTISRAMMLSEILRFKNSITISGSHGKTTTTSMVSSIFEQAKLDPTIINGGIINKYNTNAKLGGGNWIIAEADESDGSFIFLPSTIGVINNIDPEHLDFYKNFNNLKNAFLKYAKNITFLGFLCACRDDKNVRQILKNLKDKRVITFGISKLSNVRCTNVRIVTKKELFYSCFDVEVSWIKKYNIKNILLPMVGIHNIKNSLGAISIAVGLGFSKKIIREGIKRFSGVKRRFSLVYNRKIKIFDDYAHHPVEIKNVLNSLKLIKSKRIIAIHEPHRYTRLQSLFDDFIDSLKISDYLILLPVFSAGEKKIKNLNSLYLLKKLKKKKSFYAPNKEILFQKLEEIIKEGDNVIFLGAGPITKLSYEFAERIRNNKLDL